MDEPFVGLFIGDTLACLNSGMASVTDFLKFPIFWKIDVFWNPKIPDF